MWVGGVVGGGWGLGGVGGGGGGGGGVGWGVNLPILTLTTPSGEQVLYAVFIIKHNQGIGLHL